MSYTSINFKLKIYIKPFAIRSNIQILDDVTLIMLTPDYQVILHRPFGLDSKYQVVDVKEYVESFVLSEFVFISVGLYLEYLTQHVFFILFYFIFVYVWGISSLIAFVSSEQFSFLQFLDEHDTNAHNGLVVDFYIVENWHQLDPTMPHNACAPCVYGNYHHISQPLLLCQ